LYVGGSGPGNYTRIQDAINNASSGDTVFVYTGVYNENINIPLTLCLLGEDAAYTIIQGNETDVAVHITADDVNITGFCIQNSWGGGIVIEAKNTHIVGNRLTNNMYGIGVNFPYKNQKMIPTADDEIASGAPKNYDQNDFNTIVNNSISNNEFGVIIFMNSSNNTLIGNSFSDTRIGVMIGRSSHNLLLNNSFVRSGLYVFNDTFSNTMINNTVNRKSLLYLEDQSNIIAPAGLGQIILLRCHNVTVKDQELTNTTYGMELIDTDHCHISQNIIASNIASGILILNSHSNTIMNNILTANNEDGIYLRGNNNTILGNTITFNQDGLSSYRSDYTTIINNNISDNYCGIDCVFFDRSTLISGNIIRSNKDIGIQIDHGTHFTLAQNDITSNQMEGISMNHCEQIIIQNNTISQNVYSIKLLESKNNSITSNTITENVFGIILDGSSNDNLITGNNSLVNNSYGVSIHHSDSNIITHNDFMNNTKGIYCSETQKNIITQNTISWYEVCTMYEMGITLDYSTNMTISYNTIFNAAYGISIYHSNDNIILRNNIYHSFIVAIAIYHQMTHSNNLLISNTLMENTNGIAILDSNNTLIIENIITHGTDAGIKIDYRSSGTIIRQNMISENLDGIVLDYSATGTYVEKNIIKGNLRTGMVLQIGATNNIITENVFQNNILGINISGDSNVIHHNILSDNFQGIFIWTSSDNSICCNTFSNNHKHASFKIFSIQHNIWNNNYWGKSRILPQLIGGKINIWFGYSFNFPWFNIDWHPEQEPYDIPIIR
jgi:parallel beta-helix repeat protein